MARRSAHTPEELRQKILEAAKDIIEREGLVGLSAREIARAIGYSPGTLYNIFENLDDVLLTLQKNMLANLLEALTSIEADGAPEKSIEIYARAYLNFALDNKLMWNLLFAHNMAQNKTIPHALIDNVNKISAFLQSTIARVIPDASPSEIEFASKALWTGVHGVTAVAVTEKGPTLNPTTAHKFVDQLTSTYVRGLKC
jgi:AcrR family transcriptional regulator